MTRSEIRNRINASAARLDKLAGDLVHHAEEHAADGLAAVARLRAAAERGETGFAPAAATVAGMARDSEEALAGVEAQVAAYDEAAHADAFDEMVEALMALRGQARLTVRALERHLPGEPTGEDEPASEPGAGAL